MELERNLSPSALRSLRTETERNPVLSPALVGQITSFNRRAEGAEPEQPRSALELAGNALADMRQQVLSAIDRFEQSIEAVLESRRSEERAAKRWIVVAGVVLVLLVVGSAITSFLGSAENTSWISTLLSGASVAGLLYILYSPVTKMIEIANDRSALLLLPATYRLRVLSATSQEELSQIAKELYETLRGADPTSASK